jgi:hypothetical protein
LCPIISANTKALSEASRLVSAFLELTRDRAIGALLAECVTPEALALTIAMQDELVKRADEAQRLRHLQVERAQYEADLAQRRYLKVDPDNRLVATVLEAEWNTKLRELEEARAIEEHYKQSDQPDRERGRTL